MDWQRKKYLGERPSFRFGTKSPFKEVEKYSPTLAGKLSISSDRGWETVAKEILEVVGPSTRIRKFKAEKERRSPPYCISYINLSGDKNFALIELQCAPKSRKKVAIEDMLGFVDKLIAPSIRCFEVLTGSNRNIAMHGRIIESNPTYKGFEQSYSFTIPIQGIYELRRVEFNRR